MRRLRAGLSRLAGSFDRARDDREMAEELECHLQLHIESNLRAGMTQQQARRDALVSLGGLEQAKQNYRERRGLPLIETLARDIRFSLRMLAKNAGFSVVVILTLAVGLGVAIAVFSIVNTVLLRPLPFNDSARLVAIHEAIPRMGYLKMGFSAPDLAVFVREQKSFETIAAFQDKQVDLSGQGEPERVTAARVSASLFPMLGAEPMLGRVFEPEEDGIGHPVAILSYGLWQGHYGGASNIVGQVIELDRQPYAVVGVMPPAFVFPLSGPEVNGTPAGVWVPMGFTPAELQGWGGSYLSTVVGRLRSGVTTAQARSEGESLSRDIVSSYPPFLAGAIRGALNVTMFPFQEEVVGSVRTALLVLMAAVAFVLLIACANVATLLLSRATTRKRDTAIRIALGATRFGLVREMLTESVLLALIGGTLGMILAVWIKNVIVSVSPPSIPLPHQVPLDERVVVFALATSLLAALLFGVAPMLQVLKTPGRDALQQGGRGALVSRTHHRLQALFVVVEIGLAIVLLTGSGLLTRSLIRLFGTDPGFRVDHALTLNIPLPGTAYPHAAQIQDFYNQLLDRTSHLPGVRTVGISNDLPLNAREMVSMVVEGRQNAGGETPQAICQSWVLGDYFQAIGIPLLQGRWFTQADRSGSQPVAIVSSSMARRYWPDQSAIGKRIRWGAADPWETIVGVVGDVNQGALNTSLAPHVYRPYSQLPAPLLEADPFGDWHAMNLVLRTDVNPSSLSSATVAAVRSLDPDLAVANVRTMAAAVDSSFAGPRFNTILLGVFAGMAVFLAGLGIYGVLAYMVAEQTREIGVRMALGAHQRDIFRFVLGQGWKMALPGAAIGVLASFGLTRLMAAMLFGVKATDFVTFASVVVVLLAVAMLASWIPARRAIRVDPMVALRYE